MPFPKDPAPKPVGLIDDLLAVIGKEQVPNADLLARADLPGDIAKMHYGEAARTIAAGRTVTRVPTGLWT